MATPGTATAEEVIVQSQEMDITVNKTWLTSVPPVTRSAPTGSIRRRRAKMRRLTKRCCASLVSHRTHSGSFTSAANMRICNTASTTCFSRKSIPGFGQVLETRFADNISLITGALPAQFGFRNTGVIDIHTKNGAVFQQGDASVYGGSFDTIMPSFEYGGVTGKLNYYWTGSYLHDGIGIENPTGSANPLHDDTDQYRIFGYWSALSTTPADS